MHTRILSVAIVLTIAAAALLLTQVPTMRGDDKPPPKFGLDKRVPWTTSHVQGSPQPPSPYRTEFAFPKLPVFDEPLDITNAPGSDRLFITERYGKIFSIRNDPKVTKADLLLDMNQVLGRTAQKTMANYGFAPHPKFMQNGFVYVTYVIDLEKELPKGTRVSRFHCSGDPPVADPKSEKILIEWPCGGHNGGCLKFGPDGYLYIGTGDSSGIADQYQTGQRLDTLAGKMLRIDVDQSDASKACGVPKDNPFTWIKDARPEIWAYGLRQPWKFSFDSATGDLWCGNVGQDLWEQVYLIEKGGNYGWSVLEGSHAFRPERPRGPSPILMPIVEHDHANFRSLTGGFVYHGKQLPELSGAYIYGDYDSGRIWTFRYDRQKKTVSEHRELCKTSIRIVCFAEDNNGELFILDHVAGRISKLVPNPAPKNAQPFPRKLSETGLFSSTKDHTPAPGLIPYSVIAPQWVDGATKQRFLALPGDSKLEFETILYPQGAPGASPGWKFPDGAVVMETLSLEMEKGKPESSRRIETRILHQQRMAGTEEMGDQYWQGYTYVWNDEQTDAVLLEDPQGRDRAFQILDSQAPGGKRQQTWHYPSTTECSVCHMPASKYTIAVLTQQMDKDHDYGGVVANQLRTFEHIGLFTKPLPMPPEEMPHLVNYRDRGQPLDLRARSYLQSNCAHCHRKWGGGNAEFQMLATLELQDMGIVNVRPNQGTFNIPNAKV
ncbi:MAG TPA: PQQ-dependent sugar dehydrogenase, partial [Gemmataceae bacterium]|nr:PQQ-dependent sugar dehydrogenase [Gemmataceae bacterium]